MPKKKLSSEQIPAESGDKMISRKRTSSGKLKEKTSSISKAQPDNKTNPKIGKNSGPRKDILNSRMPTASTQPANASVRMASAVPHRRRAAIIFRNWMRSKQMVQVRNQVPRASETSQTAWKKVLILDRFYRKDNEVANNMQRLMKLDGMTEEKIKHFFDWRKTAGENGLEELKFALLKTPKSGTYGFDSDEDLETEREKDANDELEFLKENLFYRKNLLAGHDYKTNNKYTQRPANKKAQRCDDKIKPKKSMKPSTRTQPPRKKKKEDYTDIFQKLDYSSDSNESSSSSKYYSSPDFEEDHEDNNGYSDNDANEDIPQDFEFPEIPTTFSQIDRQYSELPEERNIQKNEKPELFARYESYMDIYEKSKLMMEVIETIRTTANETSDPTLENSALQKIRDIVKVFPIQRLSPMDGPIAHTKSSCFSSSFEMPVIKGKEIQENSPKQCALNSNQFTSGTAKPTVSNDVEEVELNQERNCIIGPDNNQEATVENRTRDISIAFPKPNSHNIEGVDLVMEDMKTMLPKGAFSNFVMDYILNIHAINHLDTEKWDSIWLPSCQLFNQLQLAPTPGNPINQLDFSDHEPEGSYRTILETNCKTIHKMTKDMDLFSKKFLIIPVNHNYHWVLTLVINPKGAFFTPGHESRPCSVLVFDSINDASARFKKQRHIKHVLCAWLKTAGKVEKLDGQFDSERIIVKEALYLPRQSIESNDCGPFACFYGQKVMQSLSRFNEKMNLELVWRTICPARAPTNIRQQAMKLVLQYATSELRSVITIKLFEIVKNNKDSMLSISSAQKFFETIMPMTSSKNVKDAEVSRGEKSVYRSDVNQENPTQSSVCSSSGLENYSKRTINGWRASQFVQIPRYTIPSKPSIFVQKGNDEDEKEHALSASARRCETENPCPWNRLLRLENESNHECSVNAIANILFSCEAIRDMFEYRSADPEKPLSNIISRIFQEKTDTTREWRKTIADGKKHSEQQDISEMIDLLLTPLNKENKLRPIKFLIHSNIHCSSCGAHTEKGIRAQCFKHTAMRQHATFQQFFAQNYDEYKRGFLCCGRAIPLSTIILPGQYHIMVINHKIIDVQRKTLGRFVNFLSNDVVDMFLKKWIIRSFVEYSIDTSEEQNFNGHFLSWIRFEDGWTCLRDKDILMTGIKQVDLSQINWPSGSHLLAGFHLTWRELYEHPQKSDTTRKKSHDSLDPYLFYYNRYIGHEQSLKLEEKLVSTVDEKMDVMQTLGMSWVKVQYLKKADDVLSECRRTLMFTYALAFYLERNNSSLIFEANQKHLEMATKKLSGLLEQDLENLDLMKLKQKVQDKSRHVAQRRKVLIEHCAQGIEQDIWVFSV